MSAILDAAKILATNASGDTVLFNCKTAEEVNALTAIGLNVNTKNKDSSTALIRAAANGRPAVVEALLKNGADVSAMTPGGWTALHFATTNGYAKTAEVLLEHASPMNATTIDGWTPLHCACKYERREIAELLLKNGADEDAKNVVGRTPLDLCKIDELRALFEKKPARENPDFASLLAVLKTAVAEIEKII